MEAHPPAECARVLQDEAKEIEGYLAGLRPEEWMKQSACYGWQVRDVAAHLAGGAEIHLGMIIRGLEGDASPGPGPARRDSDAASAATAQRAVGLREQLGPGLLDTFAANYGRFGRVLQGLGPRDWEKLAWHQTKGRHFPPRPSGAANSRAGNSRMGHPLKDRAPGPFESQVSAYF